MDDPRIKNDKKQIKKKLFEVMEEIAWLPPMNENSFESLDTDTVTGDVRNLSRLGSPAQKQAMSRINSQREFNEAFELWFSSLGFDDEMKKNKIKITTTITNIADVLEKNGIKY